MPPLLIELNQFHVQLITKYLEGARGIQPNFLLCHLNIQAIIKNGSKRGGTFPIFISRIAGYIFTLLSELNITQLLVLKKYTYLILKKNNFISV